MAAGSDGAPAFYVTSPIYYVNDRPHIGHAYTSLACDTLARFMRLDGHRAHFLTGTDEHGQKVQKSAAQREVTPQAYADQVSENFRALTPALNFSNDDFIRTTEPRHVAAAQALWRRIADNGHIYLDTYAGWYSVRDEAFYGEDELIDVGGRKVAPTGAECEWVEEESYFFDLSRWQQPLLDLYEARPEFILPTGRRNEVMSFVKGGLRDLSISRTTFDWGIPVPGNERHVMYVWLDALTNYITALGYPDTETELFRTFWPADVHIVGKDILRFHAVYWPAFLMAAGLEPPRRIFAHGWWTVEGQKMSKSLNNALDPHDLIARYGLEPVRYFLLREVPFGNDGDFSHRAMVNRINGDLANDFGNLAQRVLSMIHKNCGAAIPEPGPLADPDKVLLARASAALDAVRREFSVQAFHRGLEALWAVVGEANRYVDEQAPWALRKTDPERMYTVLYVLAEVIRRLAILAQPVLPQAMERLLTQMAVPDDARRFVDLSTPLRAGAEIPRPQGVFPRYVEEEAAS